MCKFALFLFIFFLLVTVNAMHKQWIRDSQLQCNSVSVLNENHMIGWLQCVHPNKMFKIKTMRVFVEHCDGMNLLSNNLCVFLVDALRTINVLIWFFNEVMNICYFVLLFVRTLMRTS